MGNLAYESELKSELAAVRLNFPLSMLKKFMGDPSLIVSNENFGIKDNLYYEEFLVYILDGQVRKLRIKEVASAKFL